MTGDRTPSDGADICIVGSGVAGALLAESLASSGHSVVILEAGERFDPGRRLEQMEQAIRPEHSRADVWNLGGERDAYTNSGSVDYLLNRHRVKAVGGTTLHWQGMVSRLHEKDFEMRTRYGLARDWPIDYPDLKPYYASAESALGVAGEANPFQPPRDDSFPMPPFPQSYADSLFERACEALDIEIHTVPQARNSEAYDGRSQCMGYSTCTPVCPSGAKYSADVHVRKAEEQGARVIDRAPVQRLEHDADGDAVTAAVYATPDGRTNRQDADCFVVACGGVETPRLLLLSESAQYPDGLANSSGAVGRYFMEHPWVSLAGTIDEPAGANPIGFHTSESHQFVDHESPRPGSIKLQFNNASPDSPGDLALHGGDPGLRGDLLDVVSGDEMGEELLATMEESVDRTRVGVGAEVEMLPHPDNRITLDSSQTDNHGNPVPDIHLELGSHAKRTIDRAVEIQKDILDEMGATDRSYIAPPSEPLYTAHQMGTTRMGTDPDESVVNPDLRTHDLENLYIVSSSVFVTGGVLPPTLTIAALSLRAADHIDHQL
jgi:choline dehydrogenase-like flavoprotein